MKLPLPPSERPKQFSLRHVFALIVVLSVCLALITQLRHIGWALSVGVVGLAIGWWRHDWRLSVASGTALSIFVLTYVASWVKLRDDSIMHAQPANLTLYVIYRQAAALEEFKSFDGNYPESLDDLDLSQPDEWLGNDGWGTPLKYRRQGDKYELRSLGHDRLPGGAGLEADIVYRSTDPWPPELAPLTARQFLFEAPGSVGVFQAALIASLATALVWYFANWGEIFKRGRVVTELVIAIVCSVVAAVVLAYFYVAAAGSSH
jgi:hypothetical protein